VQSRGPSGSSGVGCGWGINKCCGWNEVGCRGKWVFFYKSFEVLVMFFYYPDNILYTRVLNRRVFLLAKYFGLSLKDVCWAIKG
jgi:hypothetical protein